MLRLILQGGPNMNEFPDIIQKIQNEIDRQLDKMQQICYYCEIRNGTAHKRPSCKMELCAECFQEYLDHAEKKL